MTPSQQLTRARNCVHAYCQEQFPEATIDLRDSIFICDGFYRGRRFRCDQLSAIWFAEEDQLKIHSPDGACLVSWNALEMAERLDRSEQVEQIESIEHTETERPSTLLMVLPESQPVNEIRRAA